VLAVVISLISLLITRIQARKAERFGRRPVLVVRSDKQRTDWEIENIGKGPAVDVVVLKCAAPKWQALQMPDLSADGTAALPARWLKKDHADLIVRYASIAANERYATRYRGNRAMFTDNWKGLPRAATPESHLDYRT
jgi:hypothetical protein